MSRRFAIWLFLLVALLVAVRASAVLALGDVFFYAEELEKGTAAKAMLDGLDVPHHQLAYHYYEGGGFVMSHLNALAFSLLGPNLLALKVVSLAVSCAAMVAGVVFTLRFFGRASAVLFGLLFIFAPESFQKLSLLDLGIHFHALLFVAAILYFAARVLFEDETRPGRWFLFGIVAGFGLYFSYAIAVTLAYAGVTLLLMKRSALSVKSLAACGAGFLIGGAPLWIMGALVGGQVFDVHGTGWIPEGGASGQLERLGAFWTSVFADRGPLDFLRLALVPLALLLGTVRMLLSDPSEGARGRFLFLLLYLAFFLVVYSVSGFAVGELYHYVLLGRFSQAWFCATLAIAASLPRIFSGKSPVIFVAGWLLAASIVVSGVFGSLEIAMAGDPGRPRENLDLLLETEGYAYPQYFGKVRAHLEGDAGEKMRKLAGFQEPDREQLLAAIAMGLPEDTTLPLEEVFELYREVGGPDWRSFLLGTGPQLVLRNGPDLLANLEFLAEQPAELHPELFEALGRYGSGAHATEATLEREIAAALSAGAPEAFFVGAGHRLHDVVGESNRDQGVGRGPPPRRYHSRKRPPLAFSPAHAREFVERYEPSVGGLLWEGYQEARRLRTIR